MTPLFPAVPAHRPLSRILLVDDEPDILTVTRLALQACGGWTLETADSGGDALHKAPLFAPDLILLDWMMPGLDGAGTFAALRARPRTASVPVVFLTARVQPQEIAHYMDMGAAGVIAKPFDPIALPRTLSLLWAGL